MLTTLKKWGLSEPAPDAKSSTASNKLLQGLTSGPLTTRPPGSTGHKHDPETCTQPDVRNHHQHRQSQLLSQMLAINTTASLACRTTANRVSGINNLCKHEKVVRSNNAYRQNRSVRLVYACYFREGCHWLISTWQLCWRGKRKKMLNRGKSVWDWKECIFVAASLKGKETGRDCFFVNLCEFWWNTRIIMNCWVTANIGGMASHSVFCLITAGRNVEDNQSHPIEWLMVYDVHTNQP